MWSEVNDRSIPDSFFLKQRLNPLPDTVLSGTITNTADASDVGSFGEMVSKPSVNWYDKVGENSALDWIDPIRPKKGMAPVHIDWSTATLDDVPVDWMPIAEGMDYWDEYAQKKPFYMGVPILGRMFPNERLAKRYIESINKAHDTTVIPDLQERWVPEYWQTCWTFSADGTIPMNWAETEQQLKCLRFGSVFRTQAEAQSAAEKVKALLLSL
jgi:uncharacterized C2H2 Zn-finger protein